MAQLDPLGIMDADLDSCVPTDIITSSDKLGEQQQRQLLRASQPGTLRPTWTLSRTCVGPFQTDFQGSRSSKGLVEFLEVLPSKPLPEKE